VALAAWQTLKPFEKWQIVLTVVQTIVLLLTLAAATYIDLQQNQINQNLSNHNFEPTPEVADSDHRLVITNRGKESIWLSGITIAEETANHEEEARYIPHSRATFGLNSS
jgi:hypothetical protein